MKVPFCDLAKLNSLYAWVLKEAYNRVMSRGQYILGPEVEAFEKEWATYCGRKYAVGFGNATEALTFMLAAHGVRPGDRVIVPAHTCIATWIAVSALGAIPWPVDVDPDSFNININSAPMKIIDGCKAILAVHLYGRVADMENLLRIADAQKIPLLIDAAQAHGIKGELLGDAAAFSFYPTKNLGALGDGGAVVTDDENVATALRILRNLGSVEKDVHLITGGNSRLDELQAAFLRAKLSCLDLANESRLTVAQMYGLPMSNSVWHQCVIVDPKRDQLRARLLEYGIGTMVHYPTPPHLQQAYAHLKYKEGSFPVAEYLAKHVVSLPCGPELSEAQINYVRNALSEFRMAA